MPIKNGELADADEVLNLQGITFKNQAQLLYNAAYIGFNSKLNVAGVPNLKNIKYDVFNSDTATSNLGIGYNSTDKLYNTPDLTAVEYYFIVEATSLSSPIEENGVNSLQISSGKWLIYSTASGLESQRAKIMQTLFDTGRITNFSGITTFKVSDSDDVGYRAFKNIITGSFGVGGGSATATGTFANTTTNLVSAWSYVKAVATTGSGGSGKSVTSNFDMPSGTNHNTITASNFNINTTVTSESNEIGTNTSADKKTNPASCVSTCSWNNLSSSSGSYQIRVIVFTKGSISWDAGTSVDYYTTYTIPETTQAGSLSTEGLSGATLIFQTTSLPTITDCIATWNSSIDSENTLTVSISADGTNYEEVTDSTIHRFTNTGTNLFIKFEIDRVDTATVDKISEYAILYNITGETV